MSLCKQNDMEADDFNAEFLVFSFLFEFDKSQIPRSE